jgi:hypothetical protein
MTELVLSILVLYGKVNFMNLGRYSPYNERTFRRHFSDDRWDYGQLNGAFITETVPESHELIAVMDASFLPKSGKKTFGLDYFWNGCHQRSERGLELSLVGVVDVKTERPLHQRTAIHFET